MSTTFKISLKSCYENTYCLIPTIKTFRNNFNLSKACAFMGDNYFIGLKWFNWCGGIMFKFIKDLDN